MFSTAMAAQQEETKAAIAGQLQCLSTAALVALANGRVDAIELAKRELANRYLDINGKWQRPTRRA